MTGITMWNGRCIPRLGMGCWAIGGPFFAGQTALGWGAVDDRDSARAVACALEHGIRFFDTAQAYGAGHSETVLGKALESTPDALIATKVGYRIDPAARQITGETTDPDEIEASLEASRRRLQRDKIDIVFLHLNECSIAAAKPVFDRLARLRARGWIDAFGWSTDFPDRAAAFAGEPGYVAVQHAMNVFFRADRLVPVVEQHGLMSVNRSPLAMGLLSGRMDERTQFGKDQIRGQDADWIAYYQAGQVKPEYLTALAAIRTLLQDGGRTVLQGALAWLWARTPRSMPIPGFRTVAQVQEIAGALAYPPLASSVMDEIERIMARPPEGEPRPR